MEFMYYCKGIFGRAQVFVNYFRSVHKLTKLIIEISPKNVNFNISKMNFTKSFMQLKVERKTGKCVVRKNQRRIQNPVKHLQWSFFAKIVNG